MAENHRAALLASLPPPPVYPPFERSAYLELPQTAAVSSALSSSLYADMVRYVDGDDGMFAQQT